MTVKYNTYLARRGFAGEAKYYELSFPTGAVIIAPAGQEGSKIWWGQYLNQSGLFPSEYVRLVEKSNDYTNTAEVPVIAHLLNTSNGKKKERDCSKKSTSSKLKSQLNDTNSSKVDSNESRDVDHSAEEEKTIFTFHQFDTRDGALPSNASMGTGTIFTSNTKSKYGSMQSPAKKVNLPKHFGKNKKDENNNNNNVDDRTFTLLGQTYQTDICFALLGTKRPKLPLREELRSLGFEIVLRSVDTSHPTKQLNFSKAYRYKKLNKKLRKLSRPSLADRLNACWRLTTTYEETREPNMKRKKKSNDEKRAPVEDWRKPKKAQTTLSDILCGNFSRLEINSLLIENVITFNVHDADSVVSDTTEVDYGIHLNGRTVPSFHKTGKVQSSRQRNNNDDIGKSLVTGNMKDTQHNNLISRDDRTESYKNTSLRQPSLEGGEPMMTFVFPNAEQQSGMNSPLFPSPDMYVQQGTSKKKRIGDYDYTSNVGKVHNSLSTRIYNTNVNIPAVQDEYPSLSETMSGHDLHYI